MSSITAQVLARAMAEFPELAPGDRVTFQDRHDGMPRTGILLAVPRPGGASHASVLADTDPGYTNNTVWHLDLADLSALSDAPDRHRDALLRAAAWWDREKYMDRPETVTDNVHLSCTDALAVFAQSAKTPAGAR